MLPAVALVGRPNVGKSTIFNQLTASRDALVADHPGLTRDRRYGYAAAHGRSFVVVDTGGLGDQGEIGELAARQTRLAIAETDLVVFVVDHQEGLTAIDEGIAAELRNTSKPVLLVVNKSEGVAPEIAAAEFHRLGLGEPVSIAALHGRRIEALVEAVLRALPEDSAAEAGPRGDAGPRVAVVGRPNVGKSTLINRLLGTERMITSAEPGTTRDSVHIPCERGGERFVLVDTAGVRRRAKVVDVVEKYSVVQTLQAIDAAGVVIALLDARQGIADQDLHLLGLVVERGRALAIGVNKWDHLPLEQRRRIEAEIQRKLRFVSYAPVSFISALHGSGIDALVETALAAHRTAGETFATARLTEILTRAVTAHPPPLVAGRRARLRYAHQGGRYPTIVVVHGSRAERVPDHYRRYLVNAFREELDLAGVPLKLELKSAHNPFAGRPNRLTRRQLKSRQRVMRHRR
jgi:GTP-binding protein